MSDYTQSTDFSAKDALSSGDPNKIIYGSDVDGEFSAIATAISTKTNKGGSATTNNVAKLTSTGDLADAGYSFSNLSGAVTASTAELNKLDGATVTTTELNLLSGLTGTVWTSANDGAASGLDADTVDGNEASALLARANHTGTQTMSTISDAGALATLDNVDSAQIISNAITSSKIASDAVGPPAIDWKLTAGPGTTYTINASASQIIPEGIIVAGVTAGDVDLEVDVGGGTWVGGPFTAGTIFSDGSSVRLTESSGATSATVRYLTFG